MEEEENYINIETFDTEYNIVKESK